MHAVDFNHLPPELTTLREAQASQNGQVGSAHGKGEMDGQLARQARIKTVLGIGAVKRWRAAIRALQYLWRTKDLEITYRGTPGSCTKLSAWVDADFATCPDSRRLV